MTASLPASALSKMLFSLWIAAMGTLPVGDTKDVMLMLSGFSIPSNSHVCQLHLAFDASKQHVRAVPTNAFYRHHVVLLQRDIADLT